MKSKHGAGLLLVALLWSGFAADLVQYADAAFPYRIACKQEWQEVTRNDSMLLLANSTPGSKIFFRLKKFAIDTTFFSLEDREWSRFQFSSNMGLGDVVGRIWSSDSGATVKIGSLLAYKYFAYFKVIYDSDTVWLAEYDWWTESNGAGYLVSLFGDTLTMANDLTAYKDVVDSVRIGNYAVSARSGLSMQPAHLNRRESTDQNAVFHDLLGRPEHLTVGRVPCVLARMGQKLCVIRK